MATITKVSKYLYDSTGENVLFPKVLVDDLISVDGNTFNPDDSSTYKGKSAVVKSLEGNSIKVDGLIIKGEDVSVEVDISKIELLNNDGTIILGRNVKVNNDLTVGGTESINGDVSVSGATTLSDKLTVSGATTIKNGLSVLVNDRNTQSISFVGPTVVGIPGTDCSLSVYGDVSISKKLNVGGNATVNGKISSGDVATAKVNGVSNVELGLPIGSMTMWLGTSTMGGYEHVVQFGDDNVENTYNIPNGWVYAGGGTFKLTQCVVVTASDEEHVYKYHDKTDAVYIPFTIHKDASTNDLEHRVKSWVKCSSVAYCHAVGEHIGDSSIWVTSTEFNRLLNNIISTCYVCSISPSDASTNSFDNISDSFKSVYDASLILESFVSSDTISSNVIEGVTIGDQPKSFKKVDNWILLKLPNMKCRFPMGATDNNFNFAGKGWYTCTGSTGGEETHQLTINEMPEHTHELYDSHEQRYKPSIGLLRDDEVTTTDLGNNHASSDYGIDVSIDFTGGNAYHNNIPPYLAVNFIIKYK